jgi:DNA (cytosine-5)-methyltransferase 1
MTAISLFSGAGGAALGVNAAGFEVRAFVEWEKAACDTLRGNWTREGFLAWGHKPKQWGKEPWHQKREPAILNVDITKLTTETLLQAADLRVGECSLLEGGFPCQGFSLANSRRNVRDHKSDKRNELYLECVRIIREAQPRSFFLENVPGLVSMEKGAVIRMIARDLAECGYQIDWNIINAANYGVPQHRLRVIIVGSRNDVAAMRSDGSLEYHMGDHAGPIRHPSWYVKRYKIELEKWETVHDRKKGTATR